MKFVERRFEILDTDVQANDAQFLEVLQLR